MRRPEQAERGGIDFIDDRGTTWDLIGTMADEAMDYEGFIAALKKKIADPRPNKVGVDTRLMGEENYQKVMQKIKEFKIEEQNKLVIIKIDGTVEGSAAK